MFLLSWRDNLFWRLSPALCAGCHLQGGSGRVSAREILKEKMAFFTLGCMHVSCRKIKLSAKASIHCCSLFITLFFLWPLCHQAPCCVAFLVLKLEANDFCCGCSSCTAVVVIPWLSLCVGYRPGSEWENENFCPSEWVLWGSWMC